MHIRAAAAQVVSNVLQGHSLTDKLPEALAKIHSQRDQGLLQALCYGVCRYYFTLNAILDLLLEKPLKEKDNDIQALMLVGLFQLKEMRIPDHAAVAETVSAITVLKKEWAKSLVNAVLRNYQRRTAELEDIIEKEETSQYAHPAWLIGMIKKAWPSDWKTILIANNQHPPLMLRVNQTQLSRKRYLEILHANGIAAKAIPFTRFGIVLEEAVDVAELPNFDKGDVSIQDGAAQLAVELLDLEPGQSVLDACAAPGGKTTYIAECEPSLKKLIAIDSSEKRLVSVTENLKRLGLNATCIHSDVGNTSLWWDGQLFDRILLDVPCSATGVIRRHPDIKLLRRGEDVQNLVAEQMRLLTAVWSLLKIGGMLVYSTCSILPRENDKLMLDFLEQHTDAKEEKIETAWGIDCAIGKQILPGEQDMDGFYYARLRKTK